MRTASVLFFTALFIGLATAQITISDADRAEALKLHNDLRQSLTKPHNYGPNFPLAKNMPILTWNKDLESCAQNWSSTKIFSHDGHNCSQPMKGWTGENLYIGRTTAAFSATCNWGAAINAWFDEYKLWDANTEKVGKYAFSMKTGHFTAIIWDRTTQVGCSCNRYQETLSGRVWNTTYVVCEYFPGGNFLDQPIYTAADGNSQAPVVTPVVTPTPAPTPVVTPTTTTSGNSDVSTVLKLHNDLRQSFTKAHSYGPNFPIAKNMPMLNWDDGLAKCAKNWSDNKVFSHGGHNCSTVKNSWVGENLYIGYTTGNMPACDWSAAVNSWFSEISLWDAKVESTSKYAFRGETGHFTAIIWGKTTQVGCGCSQYQSDMNGRKWNTTYVVCEYFPGGNFLNQPIYE